MSLALVTPAAYALTCDICGRAEPTDGENPIDGWLTVSIVASRQALPSIDVCPTCAPTLAIVKVQDVAAVNAGRSTEVLQ